MKNLGNYLLRSRNLMNLERYQNLFLFKRRSVAEHSWSVAKIAQLIAHMEKEFNHCDINIGILLQKAIFHDLIEVYTGDLLSMTKRRTPSMKKAVATLEKRVYEEEFSELIPEEWMEEFKKFTLEAKDETIEGQILSVSDVLDTVLEAIEEIQLGNIQYFKGVLNNSAKKILEFPLESSKILLVQILEASGICYEEYFEEEVLQKLLSLKEKLLDEKLIC